MQLSVQERGREGGRREARGNWKESGRMGGEERTRNVRAMDAEWMEIVE